VALGDLDDLVRERSFTMASLESEESTCA